MSAIAMILNVSTIDIKDQDPYIRRKLCIVEVLDKNMMLWKDNLVLKDQSSNKLIKTYKKRSNSGCQKRLISYIYLTTLHKSEYLLK